MNVVRSIVTGRYVRRRGVLTKDDSLFQTIGLGASDIPGGLSAVKPCARRYWPNPGLTRLYKEVKHDAW